MAYRILTINPGSTSTKVGCFEGEKELFTMNVSHEASDLAKFAGITEQRPYREEMILKALDEAGIDLATMDAFVGRGGGLFAIEGGTYEINDVLLDHAERGANGVQHPAQLGPQIARGLADKYGKPSFIVNAPDTDEYCLEARMTGMKGIYRTSHLHSLNQKETAIHHSEINGWNYNEKNYVVCHIGGGVSIAAHKQGKMIDGNDIVGGEGPMAPTRCGSLPAAELIRYCFKNDSMKEVLGITTKAGGFVSHLGTSDGIEVTKRAAEGDKYAQLIWDTFIYQIIKEIGAMAATLHGKCDGILLGGGMVHNKELVARITEACSWIAPVSPYPGEFELEAMAAGAIRVLSGVEQPKVYTGDPCWSPAELENL